MAGGSKATTDDSIRQHEHLIAGLQTNQSRMAQTVDQMRVMDGRMSRMDDKMNSMIETLAELTALVKASMKNRGIAMDDGGSSNSVAEDAHGSLLVGVGEPHTTMEVSSETSVGTEEIFSSKEEQSETKRANCSIKVLGEEIDDIRLGKDPPHLEMLFICDKSICLFANGTLSYKILSKVTEFDNFQFELVFDTFPKPDSFMYGVLIKCYVWDELFGEAISLYFNLLCKLPEIGSHIFPPILKACSGFGDLGFGWKVHGRIVKCGLEAFGPTYTTGDTVGGGINYSSQEFFFTENGAVVGTVYKDVKCPLYPTVAVHSQHEEVTVNFGQEPFVFDLKAFEAQERAKQQTMIEKISIPETSSYGIVRSYLQHYGYEDTLSLFDTASQSTAPPTSEVQENGFNEQENLFALKHRKILRELIRGGKIDDAFAKLQDWYPQIVQDGTSATCFLLHCQKFIELVRVGKLEEAVSYGRTQFQKFYRLETFDDLVKDCAALLAYEQPQKSSVGYLLEKSQLEIVADAVNAMILSTNPNTKDRRDCLQSYLERVLRQLTACFLERRLLNGNQGEAFHLRRILATHKKG